MNQPVQASATASTPFRFSVDQFLALCEQGLFDDYAKSELIEGEIVVMNAQHSRHSRVKSRLAIRLGNALEALGSPFEPQIEASVRLSDGSLPEPDIVLTSYRGAGVVPVETAALLIEVSDSTLENDLGRKADLYAEAGVPEYWVIDLNENRALLHANPRADGSGYDGQLDVPFGEPLHAATIEGLTVETAGLE
ncbi:Uma2 family endonuclease [Sphingomonas sp. LB-2]|uniref:Uma2 family endonuclease n=1 Tax=Sphingomonas caeni TaxID=2984949 RepID=UPI00223096D5|nr:Uma2 family endonuclease [Sphingomonas caeni]MCW3849195.1 Uma2 family endonuclease [Sphingomonas caeni]